MSSQQDFKGIVSLSEEQYKTLSTTGTLTVGDITLTYSPIDTVYVTPETSSTDSSIELLVGTDNEPIDLYNLTAGKYYLLQGYVKQSASNNVLVKMHNDDTGTIPASVLCYRWIDFANNQKITFFNANAVDSGIIYYETFDTIMTIYESGFNTSNAQIIRRIMSLNGSSSRNSVSIYAPTTAGTSGQVLISNGEDQAPTWEDKNAVEAKVSDQSTYTVSSITNSTDGIVLTRGAGAGSINYQTAVYKVNGIDFATGRPNINTTEQMAFLSDVNNKLDANQGSENAGKVLIVGEDGSVTPQEVGMPSGSGGIIQLTGTAESPINLATSLTTGQLYSCKGVINAGTDYSFTSIGDTDDNFLLYKWSDTGLYALTCSSTNIDGVTHIFNGYQGICYILINSSGNITGVSNANLINLLNGSSSVEAGTPLSIYAPITSGEAGQVLQSNGANQAPSWVNASGGEGILKNSTYNNTTFNDHLEELYTLSATKNLKYIRFKLSNSYAVSGTQATFSNSNGSLTLTNSVSGIMLYNSVKYAFKFSGFDVNSNTLYVENQVYATNYFLRFNSLNSTPSLMIRGEGVSITNDNAIFKECIETNASEFLNENLEYLIFEYYD